MRVYLPGGWKEVSAAKFWTGSKWAALTRALFFDGSVWREIATFTPPLALENNPSSVSGIIFSDSSQGVRTNKTTATPSGGLGPFTYQYTLLTHNGPTEPAPASPTMATTDFVQGNVGPGQVYQASFRCTVTDSLGQTAISTIQATFTNGGGIGPL